MDEITEFAKRTPRELAKANSERADGAAERETDLWRDYQKGLDYQARCGFAKSFPEFVRMWEGKQWPAPTERTRNMPRPVVNIIKMICRNKKASILSSRVRVVYKASRPGVDVQAFNRFSDYICREIGQEEADSRAVDGGSKKGTYVYHYYWDSEARGLTGTHHGGVRVELIDPLSIFFADPTETDEQKQRWIIIASRQDVASVRAKADRGVKLDSIVSDQKPESDRYDTVEQSEDELCTVLIRYFRKNGEVWCEKATRTAVVNKAFPLTPDLEAAARRLAGGSDAPNNALPDDAAQESGESLMPKGARATLYPIVVGNYEGRQGSIFGIGEVEGLVPNQKAINLNLALLLLNAQQMSWGKYITRPGALGDQVITNEPGQVLEDKTNTGDGIKMMPMTGMSAQPLQLVDTLTTLTRSVTGSSEVMTGETMGANMSGAAIAQLQSQAQMPIQDLRDRFWRVKEKQGRVLAQFYKLYYRDAEYVYTEKGEDGEEHERLDRFNGAAFADVEFEVTCEAMSGTKFSTAGDINVLDVLLAKGAISIETYISAYPDDALSNKTKILEGLERDKQNQVAQLSAQIQQYEAKLSECMQVIESQSKATDDAYKAIQECQRVKEEYNQLYQEAQLKIKQANAQIEAGNARIMETEADARTFAGVLDNVLHDEQLFGKGGAVHGMSDMQDRDGATASGV